MIHLTPRLSEESFLTEKYETELSDTVFLVSGACRQVLVAAEGLYYLHTMQAPRNYWARTMLHSLLIIDNLLGILWQVLSKTNNSIIPPPNTGQNRT